MSNPLKTKPFGDIKNLNLSYVDNSIEYNGENYSTAESFDFTLYDALKNVNDLSVNNYSYFFLGKKSLISSWANPIFKNNKLNGFTSLLSFIINGEQSFLYFDSESIKPTPPLVNIWNAGFTLKTVSELKNNNIDINDLYQYQNFTFIVEYIENTKFCYIKFVYNSQTFYLYNRLNDENDNGGVGKHVDDLWFTTDPDLYTKLGKFCSVEYDINHIIFFLAFKDTVKVKLADNTELWVNTLNIDDNSNLIIPETKPESIWYQIPNNLVGQSCTIESVGRVRSLKPDNFIPTKLGLIDNSSLNASITENNITYIVSTGVEAKNQFLTKAFVNSSWVSYTDSSNIKINKEKSKFDIETQSLFHLQYNNIDNNFNTTLNIIPLKNIVSPKNNIIRGDYMETVSKNDPNINFREYTTLNTGTNQEFGDSNITLNFVFYDLEYKVNGGEDLILKTTNNTLYPFIKLNINDSKFVKNGSFGSTIPFLADKFKKFQDKNSNINNGKYLYTWLYQSPDDMYGIWLDRYYYPNIISKDKALKGKLNFDPASFTDIVDKSYISDSMFLSYVENAPYFDKQSDLVIEPETKYIYSRTGKDKAETIKTEFVNSNIFNSELLYGPEIISAPIQDDPNKVLDINFDIYLDNINYGPALLNSSASEGLSIKANTSYSYILYSFNNSNLIALNQNYEIIKSLDFNDIYSSNETILDIIIDKPFNDFAVLTDKSLYLLSYNLFVKHRYYIYSILQNANILKYYIKNNKLYFLLNQNNIYHSVISFDLKNEYLIPKELCRYSEISVLGEDITDTIYPLYYDQLTGEGNIEKYGDIFRTIDNPKYPLPWGLSVGSNIKVIDFTPSYTKDFWYFAPIFDDPGNISKLNNNSLYINSLFISSEEIYGLPYICFTVQNDKKSIYGVRERNKDSFYQVESIEINNYKNIKKDNMKNNIIFASYTKIFDISCDCENNIAIIKLNAYKTAKELDIFDKTKRLIHSFDLKNYNFINNIDAYKYYSFGIEESGFILPMVSFNEDLEIDEYFIGVINNEDFQLTKKSFPEFTKTDFKVINYNNIQETADTDKLFFSLNLPFVNLLFEEYQYVIDLKSITKGWYRIKIVLDISNNIFNVFLNGKALKSNKKIDFTNINIASINLFTYPLIFNTLAYRNNILLSDFLKLSKNELASQLTRFKNINIFNKVLKDYENQALILAETDIKPFIFTLPGGQRNNFEEIIRYFKYNPPNNVSNTIQINIKNSGIDKITDQQLLSLDILKKINEEIPCPLTIQNINFI